MKEEEKRSFEVGCDKHLSKPISKKDLLEVLENVGQE
jgi:CheY-like chemotaxis protein